MANELATRSSTERTKLLRYLPKAIERLVEAMDSDNEKIRVGAAKYILEQCIGKAPSAYGDEDANVAAATEFVKAMRQAQEEAALQAAVQEPIVEGTVRILGNPIAEEPTEGILNSDSALAEIDEF